MDLDSFLAIAEEIKLKGVAGQTSSVLLEEQKESKQTEATLSKELIYSPSLEKEIYHLITKLQSSTFRQ